MARILRRRIARHTPSAMSRRDTASEINQWLKLGLTAAQIGERLIPDDPTMTKEQMHAIIRARMAGADAPPSAARRVVDAATEEYKPLSQTGPTLSGAPAGAPPTEAERVAYQDAIDRSLGQSAAEGASSQASPTPRPLTPPTAPVLSLASEDPNAVREGLFLPPGKMGLDYGQAPPSRLGLDLDYGVPEPYTPIPTIAPAEQERQALAEIGAGEQLASNILGSVGVEPAVEPGSPQAQAVANDTIKELAVEAPKAATSADEVIAMYDKLVEASGPRGFFERLGFGMGARMDAVNKAFLTNLNKSPLARRGTGAELRAATALVLQKAKEAEAQRRREHDIAMLDERALNKEEEAAAAVARKVDAEARAAARWEHQFELKNDFQDKKTKDQLRVAQEKGRQTRLNKKTRATPATSQEQMLGKSTALDASKKIAAEEAKKIENEKELETALKDPRIAKLIKPNGKGGFTALKKLDNNETKRLLPIYRLVGKIQGNDDIIKFQTAREKAAREQMANRADIDAIDQELGLDD